MTNRSGFKLLGRNASALALSMIAMTVSSVASAKPSYSDDHYGSFSSPQALVMCVKDRGKRQYCERAYAIALDRERREEEEAELRSLRATAPIPLEEFSFEPSGYIDDCMEAVNNRLHCMSMARSAISERTKESRLVNPPLLEGRYAGGCLDAAPEVCRGILSKFGKVVGDDLATDLERFSEPDVAGRPFAGRRETSLSLMTMRDGHRTYQVISLLLDEANRVRWIRFGLPVDPARIRTAADYGASMLGEAAEFALGQCASDKLPFYQAFETRVKPTINYGDRDVYVEAGDASDSRKRESAKFEVCGAGMLYRQDKGIATALMTSSDPSGLFNFMALVFYRR